MELDGRFALFTLLIARLSRSVKRIKSEEMAEFQLKGPHVSCLYYLSLSDGLTASALCERCDEDKAAISRSLEYLQTHGYITAGGSTARRYKTPLYLTETGWAVCGVIHARIASIVEAASTGLTEEERQTMYRALQTISTNLDDICGRKGRFGSVTEEL